MGLGGWAGASNVTCKMRLERSIDAVAFSASTIASPDPDAVEQSSEGLELLRRLLDSSS